MTYYFTCCFRGRLPSRFPRCPVPSVKVLLRRQEERGANHVSTVLLHSSDPKLAEALRMNAGAEKASSGYYLVTWGCKPGGRVRGVSRRGLGEGLGGLWGEGWGRCSNSI